jgi:hypothetical protein
MTSTVVLVVDVQIKLLLRPQVQERGLTRHRIPSDRWECFDRHQNMDALVSIETLPALTSRRPDQGLDLIERQMT